MMNAQARKQGRGCRANAGGDAVLPRTSAACRVLSAIMAACLVTALMPAVGFAAGGWHDGHAGTESDPYLISTVSDFQEFASMVNSGDTFEGKYVKLGSSLNFTGSALTPIGGQNGREFNGIFDGAGNTLDNLKVDTTNTVNVGIFGQTGTKSIIKDVKLGSACSLTISLSSSQAQQIKDVGLLVGFAQGSIENVQTSGKVSVTHAMDQTKEIVFPIQNVGGIAGQCLGDITSCTATSTASLTVEEPGVPYKATTTTDTWEDQAIIVLNVGGIVGSAGAVDSTIDKNTTKAHGAISACSNSSKVTVNTPSENGLDRFGNTVFAQAANVGGIAGYGRGSISECSNDGYIKGEHTASIAGIVGCLRARTTTTSYSGNFTDEGSDDGSEDDPLVVQNCTNNADIYGYSFPAGIVGRAGTYTTITACVNGSDAIVVGTRSTKPFPSGVVGSTYGTVSYCANVGTVAAGKWNSESARTVTLSGGYYASGLVGNTVYFTKESGDEQVRSTPMPEVYGCYSAGSVMAIDNMRQRLLVGDNAGYVHDNIGVTGLCYNDRLVYGMYEDDTESAGGTVAHLYAVSADQLKSNAAVEKMSASTPLGVLNSLCDGENWTTYWVPAAGNTVNAGYPVLNTQATAATADITSASVTLAANALYTAGEAIPQAAVVLNGTTLVQNVDFKVIPQTGAVELSADGAYTATVVGIGNYTGTASQTLPYGITAGDMSLCTVQIDQKIFNWEAQTPDASGVHVLSPSGATIDPDEYTFAFDPNDEDLNDNGQAVNVGRYTVVVTAKDGSHFTGSAEGEFPIKTAKIICSKDAKEQAKNAYPTGISYLGQTYDWESMTVNAELSNWTPSVTLDYTGYSIKPDVTDVVYLNRSLTIGVDYRIVYGGSLMEGTTVEAGQENVGVAGGTADGYVTVRYVSGGNFSNYDIMKFNITDTGAKGNLADAVIKGDGTTLYESGAYEPITVWYGGSQLEEGTDYTISYQNNDRIGTASYTVTAVEGGRFTGSKSGTFELVGGTPYTFTYDTDAATATAAVTGVTYLGSRNTFDMVIPSTVTIGGVTYTVTSIADKAFGGSSSADFMGSDQNLAKSKIASVTIPATVESIGSYAFAATSASAWNNLSTVTFANIEQSQLSVIGDGAFQGCGNLTSFTFPAKVATIGNRAFNTGTVSKASGITHLTFLTRDASLPSSIGTVLAFAGVGWGGSPVTVSGYAEATAVQQFAANNAGTTNGTNTGRNFVYSELTSTVERIYGDEAYETSAKISQTTFDSSEWAIVARADDFADAMSATGLAGILDAPIILTQTDTLSQAACDELSRLGVKRVYIAGGERAVLPQVQSDLEGMGLTVERVYGSESWDTSVEFAQKITELKQQKGETADSIIVAMSINFQDALAISSYAYRYHVPIVLQTSGATSADRTLSAEGQALLTNDIYAAATVYVPGGTGAVSYESVEGIVGEGRTVRMAGTTGYDTSVEIANEMIARGLLSASTAVVASGAQAPKGVDALSGSALAGRTGGVILLTNGVEAFEEVNTVAIDGFMTTNADNITTAYVLGGTGVVPESLFARIQTVLGVMP